MEVSITCHLSLKHQFPAMLPFSSTLWHQRLGYPSLARLKLLSSFIPSMSVSFDNKCHVCPMAKQTRSSFLSSNISTSAPLCLLHCDIWGPHRISSHSGACYFLTIVDDFTRCTSVFSWATNLAPNLCLNPSFFLSALNSMLTLKSYALTMDLSFFPWKIFFLIIGLSFNVHACTHHNKMVLLNASIATFLISHVLCVSNIIYPYLFGRSVFWPQSTLLIDYLPHYLTKNPLLNCSTINRLFTLIFEFLVASIMLL